MTLWLNSSGKLIIGVTPGLPILCDTCPCVTSACNIATTSFLVRQGNGGSDVFSPTTVTAAAWPLSSCLADPGFACIWVGTVATGEQAGKICIVNGATDVTWFVSFYTAACTNFFGSSAFFGVVANGPAGNYNNGIQVV